MRYVRCAEPPASVLPNTSDLVWKELGSFLRKLTTGSNDGDQTGSHGGEGTLSTPMDWTRVVVVVKPFKLDAVGRALLERGAVALTVSEAQGYGRQKGHLDAYRDSERQVTFLPKVRLECAIPKDQLESAIQGVQTAARTGRIGDGKIFVGELE